jgi:hypothetical protein
MIRGLSLRLWHDDLSIILIEMEMTMKILTQLNEELDAFNATLNDENEDTPELLVEQERLLNAIIACEAADLGALSAKALVSHFQKRAPGQQLAKGLSKAALIAEIEALPPLAAPEAEPPLTQPDPASTPAALAPATDEAFSVASYARAHGLDCRELRKQLRAAGLRAPYTVEQVKQLG